jgi:general secretion pathway protein E
MATQSEADAVLDQTGDQRLSRWLRERGRLSESDLARAASLHSGERLSRLLVRLGLVSEREMAHALAEALEIPLVTPGEYSAGVPASLPAGRFFKEAQIVPAGERAGAIVLAMADPQDDYAAKAFAAACARPVLRAVGVPSEIDAALEAMSGGGKSRMERILETVEPQARAADEEVEHLRDLASEAPAMRLVNLIVQRAVDAGASDVHIEPFANRLRVRYRIDGVLHEAEAPPAHLGPAVVSRVKIMARLDIAERRLPQDGRISLRVQGNDYDLRVATAPTLHGESVVLRILSGESLALEPAALGFCAEDAERLNAALDLPHGMVLVTGPTGSGKSTTLYAALARLNSADRKVITVEDPVEYRMEGVNQIQVKPSIELTFTAALRSIVRHDPDVIMVGEMRDVETARICVQSALTGHLVLSTLHTNDAASTVIRLLDMGVEDYLLTSTINAIVGQRLVRRLCVHCREPWEPMPETVQRLGLDRLAGAVGRTCYRSVGCERCHGTGFRGRAAVVELLCMSDAVRRLVLGHAASGDIARAACAEGMRTMFDDGLRKVCAGVTTVEEVLRVTRESA